MEKKVFTVAQIRSLLNQVHSDKITFSKFVEILNRRATEKLTISLGELNQALSMSGVVGRSEQLKCPICGSLNVEKESEKLLRCKECMAGTAL